MLHLVISRFISFLDLLSSSHGAVTINSSRPLTSEVLRRYVKYMRGRVQSDARERGSDNERRKE
jgi:hypothetical protein